MTAISSTFITLHIVHKFALLPVKSYGHNHVSVSVSDSSPAHGENQDDVLRRRHGDKEVISIQI